MRRVILLGDSIRLGYEAVVRAELAEEAFVWAPGENGQHTVNLLLNFWPWVVAQQPDVVHLNAGLWDTRRVTPAGGGNIVPPDVYQANVERLLCLTRQHTKARVIWATTTPVDEPRVERHHRRLGFAGRNAQDVPRYNQAAREAARRCDVPINDLYQAVIDGGADRLLSPDGVHLTAEGYDLVGRAVAAAIRQALRSCPNG